MTQPSIVSKGKYALAAITLPVVAILAPALHALADNLANLQSPVGELAYSAGWISLLVCLLLLALLLLSTKRWGPWLLLAVTLLSAVAWLDSNFFVGQYGFLEGQQPDWSSHRGIGLLQAALILALAALFVLQRRLVLRHAGFINGVLLLTAIGFLYPALPTLFRGQPTHGFVFSTAGIYDLSATENVIVFVLDTLQADAVQEVLDTDPELPDAFAGFTFFRNAVADFSKTYSSIPAILSAERFDNSRPLHEFLDEAYLQRSLPALLRSEGWDVRHRAFSAQALRAHPRVSDNVVNAAGDSASDLRERELTLTLNLGLFRITPHLLKPWVYNDGDFLIDAPIPEVDTVGRCSLETDRRRYSADKPSFDAVLADEFLACSQAKLEQPAFRFYHFAGVHAPLDRDRQYAYVGPQELGRAAYLDQSRGLLAVIGTLLDRLRGLGVYDRATILVLGDHGAGELPVGLNRSQPGVPPAPQATGAAIGEQIVMGGIPAVLVKPAGAAGPMTQSDAPVQLSDVPRTVLASIGREAGGFRGEDMFTLPGDGPRSRLHRYYVFSGWNVDYILPMTEFRVDGFSWHPEAWSWSRQMTQAGGLTGRMVTLFENGNAGEYAAAGWGQTSNLGSVIQQGQASLSPAYAADAAQLLRILHYPLPAGDQPEHWTVFLDDEEVGTLDFLPGNGQRVKHLLLGPDMASMLRDGTLRLRTDREPSAVLVREIRLDAVGAFTCPLGRPIDFKATGESERYRTYGWGLTTPGGTATVGEAAGLIVAPPDPGTTPSSIEFEFSAYAYADALPAPLRVVVNGTTVREATIEQVETTVLRFELPAGIMGDSGTLDIRLELDRMLPIVMKSVRVD
jgi:hypothetical protein